MGRKPFVIACGVAATALAMAAGTGCASREARDFGGRWAPANQYAAATEAIPLVGAPVYQASPMDGTLRNLLMRWARDSGSELDYRHPADFTLHQPVRDVRAQSLPDALAQLARAFDGQGLVLRMEGNRLVVMAQAAADG